jgi:hypothetical protein
VGASLHRPVRVRGDHGGELRTWLIPTMRWARPSA